MNALGMGEPAGIRRQGTGKPFLDARLTAAFDMVPPCGLCADIGADHGKLSAALLGEGRVQHMLVADISGKALAKSRLLLCRLGLADRATFAVADGLNALDGAGCRKVEAACILGMGGETIAGVLRRGKNRLEGMTLILGAHTELPVLRAALCEIGYRLREERIAQAMGRSYLVMRATPELPGEAPYTQKELWLGPCLLGTLPREWGTVLSRRGEVLNKALHAMEAGGNPRDAQRLAEAKHELSCVKEALADLDIGQGPKQA